MTDPGPLSVYCIVEYVHTGPGASALEPGIRGPGSAEVSFLLNDMDAVPISRVFQGNVDFEWSQTCWARPHGLEPQCYRARAQTMSCCGTLNAMVLPFLDRHFSESCT